MPTANINQTDLYYLSVGQGIPSLLMHGGLGLDHTYFYPWLNPLSDVLRLIYYDHRGNGQSGHPPFETLTLEQFAADADALSTFLGFSKVAVIGHSVGGFIALTFALTYPERINHLILMNTAPAFNYGEEIMENAERHGATEEIMTALQSPNPTNDEEMRRMFEIIFPLYFHKFDATLAGRLIADTIFSGYAGASNEVFISTYDVTHRLNEIRVPTLILTGRDDFICPPSQAQIMRDGIPNSKLVIFEHSGHFPYVEEPDVFFATVRNWLDETS